MFIIRITPASPTAIPFNTRCHQTMPVPSAEGVIGMNHRPKRTTNSRNTNTMDTTARATAIHLNGAAIFVIETSTVTLDANTARRSLVGSRWEKSPAWWSYYEQSVAECRSASFGHGESDSEQEWSHFDCFHEKLSVKLVGSQVQWWIASFVSVACSRNSKDWDSTASSSADFGLGGRIGSWMQHHSSSC